MLIFIVGYRGRGIKTHTDIMMRRFTKFVEKVNHLSEYPTDEIKLIRFDEQLIIQVNRGGEFTWFSYLNIRDNFYKDSIAFFFFQMYPMSE